MRPTAVSAEDAVGDGASDLAGQVARVAAPVREQVLDVLRREIVEGRLRPGQRLVERELIQRIGVSRTTVREVIRELAAEGLVTTIPQKGAIVAAPSWQEVEEVYEVRALLEGAAAREFAERATEEHVAAIRKAMAEVERGAKDPAAMLAAKDSFYSALFEGSGNATIRQIIGSLQARVALLRASSLRAPDRPKESVVEIRAIVEALERRDGAAAAEAASRHVRRAAAVLFTQIGGGAGPAVEHVDA